MDAEYDAEKARRLRAARALTGLDQSEFAKLIGVSRSIVSQYERGTNTRHSHPFLLAWAHHSGVALEWIETGQQPVAIPNSPDNDRYLRPAGRSQDHRA